MANVNIENLKGNLRLRWRFEGKRYCLALGLPDTPTNRAIAQMKAAEIGRDIEYGMFDASLLKYRGERHGKTPIKVYELFEKYIESRRGQVAQQTLSKHSGLLSNLKAHFRERYAGNLTPADCEAFKGYLAEKLAPITLKQQLTDVKSAWAWAITRHMVTDNPWVEVVKRVPRGKVKKPQPFTIGEIRAIIQGFRTHPEYSYYADYVEFMLSTGCRIEEAIALTWEDVTDDCSQIWFGKAFYRGHDKELKAGKAGFVPLSKSLQQLLTKRRPMNADPKLLIFPSRRHGKHMDDANFRNRAWKTVLDDLNIPYRKPNSTRHTLISYWLSQGEDPLTVAKYTRTSLKMIYEHYADYIPNNKRLPELLGDVFSGTSGSSAGNGSLE
ncbi:MAG: tyrosine-type recombinase/integrase [Myxacorys californica WJT36-NPBG1]|jgi:integrase|nr:tyrosine-type recombinase/integrase [Myxacorys californica WJT36-NPBG1]